LKVHYLAAFTCAMLNNQPMGFYSPAILIKDAQRHGLRVLPVDVLRSEWDCTVTAERHLRLGLQFSASDADSVAACRTRSSQGTSITA
jgi:error-prone DNA polymerase